MSYHGYGFIGRSSILVDKISFFYIMFSFPPPPKSYAGGCTRQDNDNHDTEQSDREAGPLKKIR